MSEYIEREAAYPLAKKICEAFHSGEHSVIEMPFLILDWIDDLPAADVRPVVRGKWIQRKNWTRCVCSACSWEITFVTGNSYNYCPNCGADMRSEPPKEE